MHFALYTHIIVNDRWTCDEKTSGHTIIHQILPTVTNAPTTCQNARWETPTKSKQQKKTDRNSNRGMCSMSYHHIVTSGVPRGDTATRANTGALVHCVQLIITTANRSRAEQHKWKTKREKKMKKTSLSFCFLAAWRAVPRIPSTSTQTAESQPMNSAVL